MVGGTREVVKPAALGPSDHLPVANACAVAKDNFWRKEGCLQRASDNADKGVALPVRNRRRWERNGWCSGVILAQRSLDFLGSSDPPAPASRVAETTGVGRGQDRKMNCKTPAQEVGLMADVCSLSKPNEHLKVPSTFLYP
ncbi:uncharacterized protein [Symphalangus syndactylus]|uniref:uncharacterized protein isoform X2 n=1 Tax=Symphalangus syndactylus TaxID=9590 RepID=UPI003004685F